MTTNKRKPGRPRGSGINDARDLDAVADLLVRKPDLKKTPAISRVVEDRHPDRAHQWPAIERRLLRKWNQTEEARLAAARQRQEDRRPRTSHPAPHYDPSRAATTLAALGYGSAIEGALGAAAYYDPSSLAAALGAERALGAAGSAFRLMDGLALGGIGISQGIDRYFEATDALERARRMHDEVERIRRMNDQMDAWRRFSGLA